MKEEKPKTNIKSIMTARREMFKTKKMPECTDELSLL